MYSGPKNVLLGIDLEEFDIPGEYGQHLSTSEQLQVTREGLSVLEPLLAKYQIAGTFFTTAHWADSEPNKLREIAAHHEIASHSYYHSSFSTDHLSRSRLRLSELSGQEVSGFRMPKMKRINLAEIAQAGYQYDSSLHPTYLPGRYNYRKEPREIFYKEGIYEMPVSVSPGLRLPMFWLSFKNFPLSYYCYLCDDILAETGYLILYLHPWEFADLSCYRLPWYVKRKSGKALADRTDRLFSHLSNVASFTTHSEMIQYITRNQ